MKIETLDVEQDLGENEVAMSIDEAGMARLMTTLSGVYEVPPVAVLREYTSNAFDSHFKAGVKRPVLVTFPETIMDPFTRRQAYTGPLELTIEDFGLGMDEAELRALYGKYGASTKVNSNREIGGFGIGSKSALSISDTYSVRARKGGVEINLRLAKNANGVGVLSFSDPKFTREPNGVKVTIPIDEGHRGAIITAVRAQNFFIAAQAGSVLINGLEPETLHNRQRFIPVSRASEVAAWVQINSNASYCGNQKNSNWDSSVRFVVGGVIYPAYKNMFDNLPLDGSARWWETISSRMADLTADFSKIYINLPIGGIKLAPNREKIQLIESNAITIRATIDEFFTLLPKAFSSAVNKIDDRRQALDFISANWRMLVSPTEAHPQRLLDYTQNRKPIKVNLSVELNPSDFRWRDLEVPSFITVGTKGWASVNAARGVNIESHVHNSAQPIPALAHLIRNGMHKQPLLRFLIEAPDLSEASIKSVRNHIRAYAEATFTESSAYAYIVAKGQVDGQMRDAFHAVSLTDFERIAKDHRRHLNSLIERKPKSAIKFVKIQRKAGDGVMLSTTVAGDVSLSQATFFSAQDAAISRQAYTALYRMFSAMKKDDGKELDSGTHLQASAPTYLTRYLGKPLYVLGGNRGAKVVAQHFDEANNLLLHVYRDAQKQLKELGEARFGAMVAAGSIFGPGYNYREAALAEPLNVLAVHAAAVRSERLRHTLTFHKDATVSQMDFARVLGMIDWSRFERENEGLDADLMRILGKNDESRFAAWFEAFAKIKRDNAKVIVSVLDALATHHGWA